jgi:hypothetical protein
VKKSAVLVFFFLFSSYFLWGIDAETGIDLIADPFQSTSETNGGLFNAATLASDDSQEMPEGDRDRACQGTCGDINFDGAINITDAINLINAVFTGGDPPQPLTACGDANTDARVNISDACYIIVYIFAMGSPPGDCSPGAWTGDDCCPF